MPSLCVMQPLIAQASFLFVCRLAHRKPAPPPPPAPHNRTTRAHFAEPRLLSLLGAYLDVRSLIACAAVSSVWYEALADGNGWCTASTGVQLVTLDQWMREYGAPESDETLNRSFAGRLRALETLECVVPESEDWYGDTGLHVWPLLQHLTALRVLHIERFALPKYGSDIPALDALVRLERLHLHAFNGGASQSGDRRFRVPPLPLLTECHLELEGFDVAIACKTLRALVVRAATMSSDADVFGHLHTLDLRLCADHYEDDGMLQIAPQHMPRLETLALRVRAWTYDHAVSCVRDTLRHLELSGKVLSAVRHLTLHVVGECGTDEKHAEKCTAECMAAVSRTLAPQLWRVEVCANGGVVALGDFDPLLTDAGRRELLDMLEAHLPPTFLTVLAALVADYATGVSLQHQKTNRTETLAP